MAWCQASCLGAALGAAPGKSNVNEGVEIGNWNVLVSGGWPRRDGLRELCDRCFLQCSSLHLNI